MADDNIRTMEMVRAIRDRFYEDTKDLSREELMAFVARAAKTARAHTPVSDRETPRGPPA
jgi:hypothetical protein